MANQHTKNTERQKFLVYVTKNPDCSSREVAEAFGLNSRHIGAELDYLARQGFLTGEKDGRRMYWRATGKQPVETRDGAVPRQIVTQSWAAPKISGHWLDFALAGRAQVAA